MKKKDAERLLLQNSLSSGRQNHQNKHLNSNVLIHTISLLAVCSENAQTTQPLEAAVTRAIKSTL